MSKPWKYIPVGPKFKAKIDTEDFARVSKLSWRAITRDTKRMKVVATISTPKGPRHITLGKFLMKPPKGKFVYPRRWQDGFDYRKSNLIVCTKQEMQRLLPKSSAESSSKFKGVSYMTKEKRWRARIRVDGEIISLGIYRSETEAAEAYNRAAKEYFGNIGYQNVTKPRPKIRRED
jgi:hypothetical protein